MAEDSDGIQEAIEGQLRVVMTAAAHIGERLARAREEALRRAQARSEQEARELGSRFEAERRTARAELSTVHRAQWWEGATSEQVGHLYEVARAWAREDPEAARAEERIRQEVRARYGVDVDELVGPTVGAAAAREPRFSVYEFRNETDGSRLVSKTEALAILENLPPDTQMPIDGRAGLADVRSWKGLDPDVDRAIAAKFPQLMSEAELAAVAAEVQRRRQAEESAQAQALLQVADREDLAADQARVAGDHEPEAEVRAEARQMAEQHQARASAEQGEAVRLYDSAERRALTVRDLESQGVDSETIATVMRADVSQGKPATEATKLPRGKSPVARKTRRGHGVQAQRRGPER